MMDKDYLYQIDIREWIERGLDADIMVPVSGNKIDKKYDIYLQSFLLPLNEVENDMENDTYNAHTLMPGITVYGSWEDDEKVYHRWGNDNGYEPLAELLKADVAAYNKALSDLDTEIKALKDKMEQLKKDATAKKKEANELNKQIVNTEATIDSINVLLDNSGFEGFHLRAKDGVANTYEVIRPDGTVAEKLSEGERNFIAFLYYYHLVKGRRDNQWMIKR